MRYGKPKQTNDKKNLKSCGTCAHVFHRAGDCDNCNCGSSELIFSKSYLAMGAAWLAGGIESAKLRPAY
jgi:hypothetical protein